MGIDSIKPFLEDCRKLMFAYKSDLWKEKFKEEEFEKATRQEAIRMKNELNNNKSNILRLY